MTEENVRESKMKEPQTTAFIERLQRASTEIDSLKSSFSKGMDDLAKIQSMISMEGAQKLGSLIDEFEDRLMEAERRREEALEGARKYSDELEKEKERLIKLWDAYKNQEESLSGHEKQVTELENKLHEAEQTKQQIEEDFTARINTLQQKLAEQEQETQNMAEFKQKMTEFENIQNQLEETIHGLRGEVTQKEETIKSLETQVAELKKLEDTAEFKDKFEEVSEEYEKEKERLTKLFRLYEQTEAENTRLKEKLNGWQKWFDSNEEIFSKLFSSVDHLRKKTPPSTPTKKPETTETSSDEDTKKRKLRFKK
jgi:chromosome segregation ATPase